MYIAWSTSGAFSESTAVNIETNSNERAAELVFCNEKLFFYFLVFIHSWRFRFITTVKECPEGEVNPLGRTHYSLYTLLFFNGIIYRRYVIKS